MSIWQYREIKAFGKDFTNLSLGEASTPLQTLKHNQTQIYIKREDKNPTGSFKDRASAFKISKLSTQKVKHAVISSSGNAAISYLNYAKLYPDLALDIIVSDKNTNPDKLDMIKSLVNNTHHQLHQAKQAKKLRAQIIASKKAESLSSAFNDDILVGYWSLGFEIAELINKEIKSQATLFMPVSSGAGLVGLMQGLSMRLKSESWLPQVHVCQTSSVHPVVDTKTLNEQSLADSITDKSCLRLPQIRKIISETNGGSFAITNDELNKAKSLVSELSYTSLLSIAGMQKHLQTSATDVAICIATGS